MFNNDHRRRQDNSESGDEIKGLDVSVGVPDIKVVPFYLAIVWY